MPGRRRDEHGVVHAAQNTGATKMATDSKNDSNKEKALSLALGSIEKAYGKGAIMRLGDAGPAKDIEVIPSG